MTYKARLDQLMLVSIQKSNAFIDVVSREGQSNSPEYRAAHDAWEAAERDYVSLLSYIEKEGIDPQMAYPALRNAFRLGMKDIAAALFL